jgi:serine/threonine protein phosphatase 1
MHKRWVVPDIHGCLRTLKTLVEEQIKPDRYDKLYFLGDYIDRGPDSKGVIDYIRKLQDEKYDITAIRGNHEDFVVELYEAGLKSRFSWFQSFASKKHRSWMEIGGKDTLRSFGITELRQIPSEYIDWMKSLAYYVLMDDFILVHAGLNFEIEDPFADTESMLWTREYKIKPDKIGNRRIIHGHVPVNLELMDMAVRNKSLSFIDLDNGPYIQEKPGFGNLVAIELNSMEMAIQDNRDY